MPTNRRVLLGSALPKKYIAGGVRPDCTAKSPYIGALLGAGVGPGVSSRSFSVFSLHSSSPPFRAVGERDFRTVEKSLSGQAQTGKQREIGIDTQRREASLQLFGYHTGAGFFFSLWLDDEEVLCDLSGEEEKRRCLVCLKERRSCEPVLSFLFVFMER